ncbi:hypothetical protein GCM10010911_62680 [Paenibacillus nasutitermitis]|uniref:Uncharacterized protein n=1 Tax=Paenibacillus nasutitermitis TaxID=1652958 RepID=A0A917E2R3_9BACL|nr:hypothetical protein [Paenibacillus nasutitermitis]GGD95457.1 hypothetical protein GCM10010911_62680 [Paenibacillus nasutitermitis]
MKAAASRSVGIRDGSELAKMELKLLLIQYEWFQNKLEELGAKVQPYFTVASTFYIKWFSTYP